MSVEQKQRVKLEYTEYNGEIHHVDDFQNYPKPYPFMTCPGCTAPVTPVLGSERAHHARHSVSSDCYGESAEHLNAKARLFIELIRSSKIEIIRDCDCTGCHKSEVSTFCEGWSHVFREHQIGPFRADIALLFDNRIVVAVEVMHTHESTQDKINYFRESGIRWIEVRADRVLRWSASQTLPYLRNGDGFWRCATCKNRTDQEEITPIKFIHYEATELRIDPEFAIQWSRKHNLWHCIHCRAVSKNQNYDAITHGTAAMVGDANPIVHSTECRYWKYLENLGK